MMTGEDHNNGGGGAAAAPSHPSANRGRTNGANRSFSSNNGRRPPPRSAFSASSSSLSASTSASGRKPTGPSSTYREDNPPGGSFRVEDDAAVDGVADGNIPDFTPISGVRGYSSVGGRRSRRRYVVDATEFWARYQNWVTFGLAAALIAVMVSSGRRNNAPSSALSLGGPGANDGKSCSVAGPGEWAPLPPSDSAITTLAFGSSADQDLPQPHWDSLALLDPDVTVLMGDNVYGECDDDACTGLRDAYDRLADHPSFIGARRRLPMVATLDDHDYGRGSIASFDRPHDADSGHVEVAHEDGDGTESNAHDDLPDEENAIDANGAHAGNPHKDVAKSLFLDFFGVPSDDERRKRTDDGVYTSYEWGPDGRRVQLILLDVRYGRSEFRSTGNSSAPHSPHDDDDGDKQMLSERQWSWLAAVLDRPADVRFVVSSVQVVADGHSFECWRMIPKERNRLYALLKRHSRDSKVLILSGDRLVGGFYEHDSTGLKEVTSSSFTHSLPYGALPPCSEKDAWADDYDWEQCDEKDPRRIGGFVHENNFGFVEIDWEKRTVNVSLRMANTYPAHSHGSKKRIRGVKNAGSVLMERTYDIPQRGRVRK